MTLEEKFKQWAEDYKREGRQEGRLEGAIRVLQRQFTQGTWLANRSTHWLVEALKVSNTPAG